MLQRWAVRGVEQVSEGDGARDGSSCPRAARSTGTRCEQSRAAIDSLYRPEGYYAAQVKVAGAAPARRPGPGRLRCQRGPAGRHQPDRDRRQLERFSDDRSWSSTWPPSPRASGGSRRASTTSAGRTQDMRERLPAWYGDHGYIDFQVIDDSLMVDSRHRQGDPQPHGGRGAALPRRHLRHRRATGGSRSEELLAFYPFGPVRGRRRQPVPPQSVQPRGLGQGHREGPDALRQQRLHLRPGRAAGDPADRPDGHAGGRPALDHPRGPAGHRSTRSRSSATT